MAQAGRLEIEIVAEIARLQADMEKVKRAVKSASDDVAKSARAANDNLGGFGRGAAKAGQSSRLAGHHVQNLAFQFQDIAIGLQGGQKPMTVFLQQGSQIAGVMGQAGIGVGGLAKELGGMTARFAKGHPALVAFTVAAGGAFASLKQFQGEVDKSGELTDFAKALGLTKKEMEKVGVVSITTGDAIKGLWVTIRDALNLQEVFDFVDSFFAELLRTVKDVAKGVAALLYAAFVGTFNAIVEIWKDLPSILGEAAIGAANAVIRALEAIINGGISALNKFIAGANTILGKFTDSQIGALSEVDIGQIENNYAGAGAKAAGAFSSAYSAAFDEAMTGMDRIAALVGDTVGQNILQAAKDRIAAKAAELIDDRTEKKVSDKAKEVGKDAGQKLFEQMVREATAFAERLEDEIAKFGKTAIEIHRLEVAAAAAAAPLKELRDRIIDAGAALEGLMITRANTDFETNTIQPLKDELRLLGLVGPAREFAALALEETAFKAKLVAAGVTDVNEKWEEYARLSREIIEGKSALEAEADHAERLNQQMDALLGSLGRLGGVGGMLGDIGGVLSSKNPIASLLGMGGIGSLLGIGFAGSEPFEKLAKDFEGTLRDTFGLSGPFANTLGEVLGPALQGAGIGAGVHSIVGGSSTGSQLGGSLGGVLGSEFLAGGAGSIANLGAFAGPIGAIAGSILGAILPKILQGNEKGRATFNGAGGFAVSGDNNSREQGAADLARAVIEAADNVAEALGATSYSLRGTIGVRNNDIRFNPTGTSLKEGLNFGQDAEAALKAAVANATYEGLSETFERLLKGGGDVEVQLDKILSLRAAFAELEQATDPVGAAIAALNKDFDYLRSALDEGNASAEERAKIEELYAIKLAEANGATSDAADLTDKRRELEIALLAAQGDVLGAVALAREAELASLDESLRPLQEQVYAAELLSQKRALEIQLMEAEGDAAGALAAQRAIELAAMDASLHPLARRIYALQDAARAEAELAAAMEHGRTLSEQTLTLYGRLLESQGNSTGALAVRREQELAAMDASLRPMLLLIHANEDAAASAAELAAQTAEAARQAEQLAAARASLEIREAELLGNAQTAINIARGAELLAMDASLVPLQQRIWMLEDAAAAEAKASQFTSDRFALEQRLYEATGNAAYALSLRREQELAAVDPLLRGLLETVHAAEDAAAATGGLATALDLTAERTRLQIRLLEAQGNAEAALALTRQTEIASTHESLQGLLAMVHAAEDAATAARRQAEAQEAANRASEEAARIAEDIARQRGGLQVELLRAQGHAEEALALERAQTLAGLDSSLHSLQREVWAAQDALQGAEDAQRSYTDAINAARSDLTEAYQREAGALGDTISQFEAFGDSLREFRNGLFAADSGTAASYKSLQVDFIKRSALAATGDVDALGGLSGAGSAFLEASKAQASTAIQYQRDVAMVARSVDAAIGAADDAVDYAQEQLTALQALVSGYIDINDSVLSVADAIGALEDLLAGSAIITADSVPVVISDGGQTNDNAALQGQVNALTSKIDRLVAAAEKTALETEKSNTKGWQRIVDNDAIRTREQA